MPGPAVGEVVVEAPVLAVVAGLLAAEGGRGLAQVRIELGQRRPHRAHEVRLGVGHQQ